MQHRRLWRLVAALVTEPNFVRRPCLASLISDSHRFEHRRRYPRHVASFGTGVQVNDSILTHPVHLSFECLLKILCRKGIEKFLIWLEQLRQRNVMQCVESPVGNLLLGELCDTTDHVCLEGHFDGNDRSLCQRASLRKFMHL